MLKKFSSAYYLCAANIMSAGKGFEQNCFQAKYVAKIEKCVIIDLWLPLKIVSMENVI